MGEKIDIRKIWDEAEAKYQQFLQEQDVQLSRVAAYLMIQQDMGGVRPVLPSLEGVDIEGGGIVASPIPAFDEIKLRWEIINIQNVLPKL